MSSDCPDIAIAGYVLQMVPHVTAVQAILGKFHGGTG